MPPACSLPSSASVPLLREQRRLARRTPRGEERRAWCLQRSAGGLRMGIAQRLQRRRQAACIRGLRQRATAAAPAWHTCIRDRKACSACEISAGVRRCLSACQADLFSELKDASRASRQWQLSRHRCACDSTTAWRAGTEREARVCCGSQDALAVLSVAQRVIHIGAARTWDGRTRRERARGCREIAAEARLWGVARGLGQTGSCSVFLEQDPVPQEPGPANEESNHV